MLKRRRLISEEQKAVMRKPQWKALAQAKEKAIKELSQWFLSEYELHGNQGWVLASEIIPMVIREKLAAIAPSAPDVFLSEQSALEIVLADAKKKAMEMDERDELEKILDEWENRDEALKHGL